MAIYYTAEVTRAEGDNAIRAAMHATVYNFVFNIF